MQPWKKRQNHDCIFIMWKDKLHYLFLIKISPTTFASTFDPKSSDAVQFGNHPDQQFQLLFYAAVT